MGEFYDPAMMLKLLLYSDSIGVTSYRETERRFRADGSRRSRHWTMPCRIALLSAQDPENLGTDVVDHPGGDHELSQYSLASARKPFVVTGLNQFDRCRGATDRTWVRPSLDPRRRHPLSGRGSKAVFVWSGK